MIDDALEKAVACGELRRFDVQLARHIGRLNGECGDELMLACALVSNRLAAGNTCLSLAGCGQFGLFHNPEIDPPIEPPRVDRWRAALTAQAVVGAPGDSAPLILTEQNKLYLGRYWQLEDRLIQRLRELTAQPLQTIDRALLRDGLARLFAGGAEIDWQRVAVANAVIGHFSVITGGPGTGKTYTVAGLLALLAEQWSASGREVDCRIALAAPTGKAAARLTESIAEAAGKLDIAESTRQVLDVQAQTLHRLLRINPDRVTPYYHADNPLPFDLLIVDEASMIDLPLMARTLDALDARARVVLLGDQHQLSSVESGMVLGDICGGHDRALFSPSRAATLAELCQAELAPAAQKLPPVADHIVYLQHSHRTSDSGGISALAAAINAGDASLVLKLLGDAEHDNLQWVGFGAGNIDAVLQQHVVPVFADLLQQRSADAALARLDDICVLCALREGPSGVAGINRRMQQILEQHDLIDGGEYYYPGLPIMISRNSASHRLSNGERGVVLPGNMDRSGDRRHPHDQLKVYFDGSDGTRALTPQRLPAHERFYATTIHKSQGSEYNTVVVVLPNQDNPILTRELLYTAVTRARRRVVLIADEAQLHSCVTETIQRESGLRQALWPLAAPVERARDRAPAKADSVPVQQSFDF